MATQTTTKNWLTTNLGEICSFLYGKSLPEKNRIAGSFPVYGSNGVVGSHNEALVKLPGIIIGRKGSIGLVHFSKSPFCPIDTTFYITQDESNVDLRYLYYFLKSIGLNKLKADVGVPGINREMVYRETVSVPNNIKEQKAIARVLMTVQEAIDGQEAFISKLKELKRSMMNHLFTHGTKDEKTKMTEIGEVPESWDVARLAQFSEKQLYIQNGFPCGNWNDQGVGILQIRPFNITDDGKISLSSQKHIETDKHIKGYLLKINDIIFNNTNSEELVGKTAQWLEDIHAVLSNHMTIIRVLEEKLFNQTFLANYLHHLWQAGEFYKLCRRHVNQASVSIERLTSVPIPYPPITEQKRIGDTIKLLDQRIDVADAKMEIYQNLFKTLLHELMSGERRVANL
jgi:type I restriction enzyme S subunit